MEVEIAEVPDSRERRRLVLVNRQYEDDEDLNWTIFVVLNPETRESKIQERRGYRSREDATRDAILRFKLSPEA